ncbi:MAG: hypothetical protein EYC68_07535 [Chloroflexota bacterium]|nr:MAG: hypothetical protein EYC68_07535 [Chloroflexota bacterium]
MPLRRPSMSKILFGQSAALAAIGFLLAILISLMITSRVWATPAAQNTEEIPLYPKLTWERIGTEEKTFTIDQGVNYFNLPGTLFKSKGIPTKPSADIIDFYSQKNLAKLGWELVSVEEGVLLSAQTYFKAPTTYLHIKMGGCKTLFLENQPGPGYAPEFCIWVWRSTYPGSVPIPIVQSLPVPPEYSKPLTVNYSNPLPVPTFSQNDGTWKSDRLGWTDPGYPSACDSCFIGNIGCWTTAYSMLYNYYSSSYTNPRSLNSNLNSGPNGGPRYGGLNDPPHCNNGMPGGSPYAPSGVTRGSSYYNNCAQSNCIDAANVQIIQNEINAGRPLLSFVHYSGTTPQHMVVIRGYSGSTYYINDPWDGGQHTLSSGALGAYVVDYIYQWNGTPPGGGGSCSNTSAGSNEIVLFSNTGYGGNCKHLSIGDYPDASQLSPVGNDDAESIKVGSNVKAILYENGGFGGISDTFTGDDSNLNDNSIGSKTSSVKVQNRPPPIGQWHAEYFPNDNWSGSSQCPENFSGPSFSKDWGDGSPCAGISSENNFTGRFTGTFNFSGGAYWFHVNHDDGATFWIDDMNSPFQTWQGTSDDCPRKDLGPGDHTLRFDYHENTGAAHISLEVRTSDCVQSPGAPILNSPSNGAVFGRSSSIPFSWNATNGASQYYAEMWGGPGGNTTYNSGWISGTSWTNPPAWGGSYQWHTKAKNSAGQESGWSETRGLTVKYGAPSNLSASAASSSQINLSWSASADGPGNIDGYRIYRNGSAITTVGNGTTTYNNTGLSCNTAYSYFVKAYKGSAESDASNTASATTSACPISVTVTNVWTTDGNDQAKTVFNPGDSIKYYGGVNNSGSSDQTANFVWSRSGPCGSSTLWSGDLTTGSGTWNWSLPGSINTDDCAGTYTYQMSVTFNGSTSSKSTTFTVNQICYTLTKNISPNGTGTVTASPSPNCNNGTQYTSGTEVTLTATANTDYSFSNWSGDASGSVNQTTVTMNGNKNVTANFTPSCYLLNVVILPGGSGEVSASPAPNCPTDPSLYKAGTQVTLTAIASPTSDFTAWFGNVVSTANPIAFLMSSDKHISANFVPRFNKTSPADGASDQPTNPTITWESTSSAQSYEYCLDTTDDNSCTANNWINVGNVTSKQISGLNNSTTYYWQVQVQTDSGPSPANKGWWRFTTQGSPPGAFGKGTPPNGGPIEQTNAALSWGTSDWADSYDYCYDTSNDNQCENNNWNNVGKSRYAFLNLSSATTYYWQVRARNSVGTTEADNGEWWSFTVQGTLPSTFNKASPPNGATNQPTNPTLSWDSSNGATSYEYCYDLTNDNACDGNNWMNVGNSTSSPVNGFSTASTYYWQIRARNSAGTTDADNGAWWSFTTITPPTDTEPKKFEDKDPAMQYVGTWTASNYTPASGGTYRYSSQVNAKACLTVTNAVSFSIGTITGGNRGIANVLVDDAKVATFDGFGKITLPVEGPYSIPDTGQHTVCIQVSGLKNPSATGTYVVLDYFIVNQIKGPACYTLNTASNPPNGGTVTRDVQPNCNNTQYNPGTSVRLTATANTADDYSFDKWSDGVTDNPRTVTMDSNKDITAIFKNGQTPPPPPPSALLNPGFENDQDGNKIPDNWGTNTKFQRVSKPHIQGSYAGRLTATDNKAATIAQRILNLTGGTTYAASCQVNIPATTDVFSFRVQIRWYDSATKALRNDVVGQTFKTKTSGWVRVTKDIVAPAGATQADFQLVATSLNTKIHIDDCSFMQK